MSYKSIGMQLQLAREQAGYSQEQLAAKIGCSQSTLSNYEKGKRRIYLAQLEKIALLMNRPIEFFLRPADNAPTPSDDRKNPADYLAFVPSAGQMQTSGTTSMKMADEENKMAERAGEQKLLENYRLLSEEGQELVQGFVDWIRKREMAENG